MADIRRTIIAAVARNGIIGRDGDMPWRLSSDRNRLRALPLGKPATFWRDTLQQRLGVGHDAIGIGHQIALNGSSEALLPLVVRRAWAAPSARAI